MKTLYPELNPYHTFFLETDNHHVYVELSGNSTGIPVIFLHGGPCSGTKPDHRRFFNPDKYHIILFDQRGCGQSLPFGELENNTTHHLIQDMEKIRTHLHIDKWLVFGGSWGSTLALLYAQQHTDKVLGLIVRAIFLARKKDIEWFINGDIGRVYPQQWYKLLSSIHQAQHETILETIYNTFWSGNELAQRRITKEWTSWNAQVALGGLYFPHSNNEHITEKMVKQVSMELHYAINKYFIEENTILENCSKLKDIPVYIIHGQNDLLCPLESSFSLHQALPHADYKILPTAGHTAQGDEMINALVSATDNFC